MVHLPDDAPAPRLCLIEKTASEQEYGYNLHAEKGRGQFVGMVDKGSLADKGGLRTGDRIFAVNGHSIVGESHKKVVERIKEHKMRCEMLVIDEEGARWYADQGIPINLQLPNINRVVAGSTPASRRVSAAGNGSPPPAAGWYAPSQNKPSDPVFVAPPPPPHDEMTHLPLICRLDKSSPSDEFGFNLHAEKGRGHFIGTVDAGGIGDRAGLKMGQRIVGVNGLLVYPNTPHKEVVGLIKKSPMATTLLVASEDVDKWFREHDETFSFEHAQEGVPTKTQLSPHSIHISDEEEIHHSPLPKSEEAIVHAPPAAHLYDEPPVASPNLSAQYDLPPLESGGEDLLAAVFAGVPSTDIVLAPVVELEPVPLPVEQVYLEDHHGHSRAPSEVSVSPRESAVDVPAYNAYTDSAPVFHSQVSPVSNGSSNHSHNGYSSNDSAPHVEKYDDIFGLSAKEARERLRQNKKRAVDMSLEEKYRLVSNM